jgi:AcrR family transcriptional regulator
MVEVMNAQEAVTDGGTPERLSRAERKAQTRAALLAAARSVVARRGMQAATHEEIAREAGLTIGAIYSNFDSKADLMAAVWGEVASHSALVLEERANLRECLEALAHRLVRAVDEDPESVDLQLEYQLFAIRVPEARDRRLPHWEAGHARHADVLERVVARSHEVLPVPARDFAEAVSSLAFTLMCSRRVLGPAAITEERMVNALLCLVPACP